MMNNTNRSTKLLVAAVALLSLSGCTREIETDTLATYPQISEVFLDGFASDLQFQAWGKVTNFDVDKQTKYEGVSSIKIEVPRPSDPLGNWAGGNFYSSTGRDLSTYDALTFYAKSSTPTTLETGFGNSDESTDFLVTAKGVQLNANWTQVIIPIPNAAKLVSEKGLFYYSAGAVDDEGYTIWIDEVRFERLGTLAHPSIQTVETAGFPGNSTLGTLTETINLPNGVNRTMEVSSKYFTFESSDPSVATIANNTITVHQKGTAVITAKEADGQIRMNCYDFAATPSHDPSQVISLFSDAYTNTISANWNPRWEWSTAEYKDMDTGEGHVASYTALNFVGIVFNSVADCSQMTHLHVDVLSVDEVNSKSLFKVEIHNSSANKTYELTQAVAPSFKKGEWVSLDIPLSDLTNRQITQLVLGCDGIANVLLDNIYFYKQ